MFYDKQQLMYDLLFISAHSTKVGEAWEYKNGDLLVVSSGRYTSPKIWWKRRWVDYENERIKIPTKSDLGFSILKTVIGLEEVRKNVQNPENTHRIRRNRRFPNNNFHTRKFRNKLQKSLDS